VRRSRSTTTVSRRRARQTGPRGMRPRCRGRVAGSRSWDVTPLSAYSLEPVV